MSYSWARWDQMTQVNFSPTTPLIVPQRFPRFVPPAQFPTRERVPQLLSSGHPALYPQSTGSSGHPALYPQSTGSSGHPALYPQSTGSSSYPALYPQLSGNFSAQAQGSFTPIHQSVTGPTEPHPAAWAAHMFAPMKKYRCGYCGRNKESTSGAHDKRIRIRCECGGPKQGGKARMHSK